MEGKIKESIAQLDGFLVAGIAVRTSNAVEMTADGLIGKQWQRFYADNIVAQIPNKTDSSILAVYTEYESDKNGPYTFLLGARVSSTENLPESIVAKSIPAGSYRKYQSTQGPVWEVVPKAWQQIWSMDEDSSSTRNYLADYEVYDERAANPQNAVVDIYVGVNG